MPSTAAFARVYTDPFLKMDARLPLFPVRASLCQYRYAEFNMLANSSGNAWAAFQPMNLVTNNQPAVVYTNGPGASNTILSTATNTATVVGGGPYTGADFNPGSLAVRLVAFGYKINYTGTELNAGGTVTLFQKNPRTTVNGMDQSSICSQYTEWKQYPIIRGKVYQYNRLFTDSDDAWYSNFAVEQASPQLWTYTSNPNASNEESSQYMCIYVSNPTAGATYRVQVAAHYEIVGRINNTIGTSITHVDTVGHTQVVNLVAAKRSIDTTTPDHTSKEAGGSSVSTFFTGLGKDLLKEADRKSVV